MNIPRVLRDQIRDRLSTSPKAVILYGPRQTGKTTLVHSLIRELPYRTMSVNGEEERYRDVLMKKDVRALKSLVSGYDLLFIDEAQHVPDIGFTLKLLIDYVQNIKLIVTGSSSLDLASKVSEPLTGRKWTYTLYPIAFLELKSLYNEFELRDQKEERLIWGSYPEIFSLDGSEDRQKYLSELARDYLFKDILALGSIRNPIVLRNLLKLLAFQVGSEVSIREVASRLEASKETVAHYIDLLEKAFIIFRLTGFSRNLRKEVTKMHKYYFYDLGIRNILIDNVKPLSYRNDHGALWENFLIIERMKRNAYKNVLYTPYFWRTYTGAEIDYVEDRGGALYGFELKYSAKIASPPASWLSTYPNGRFETVNQNNFLEFIL